MFSSDPFQRLTAGGTFSRTFQIFAQRYDLFLIISGFVFVPLVPLMSTIFHNLGFSMHTMLGGPSIWPQNTTTDNDFDDAFALSTTMDPSSQALAAGATNYDNQEGSVTLQMNYLSWQLVVEYVVFMCFAFGGRTAMVYAVAELYAGRDPSWLDCCKRGLQRWCNIFRAIMLVNGLVFGAQVVVEILFILAILTKSPIMVFLGCVLLLTWFAGLMFAMVSLGLLAPVIMVEGTGPVHSIKRCWELSWNNRCYIFCTVFCLCMMYYLVQLVLYVILASSGGLDLVFSTWGAFVIMSPILIYLPLATIAETVVYINIRVQQEGLNKPVLEGELYEDSSITKSTYALVDRGVNMEVV